MRCSNVGCTNVGTVERVTMLLGEMLTLSFCPTCAERYDEKRGVPKEETK